MKKSKISFQAKPVILGMVISLAIMLTGCLVCSALISEEKISPDSTRYCVVAIHTLAAMLGCWVSVRKVDAGKAMTACAAIAGYVVILLSITALFFEGSFRGVGLTLGIIGAGGVCGVMAGARRRKRKINFQKRSL